MRTTWSARYLDGRTAAQHRAVIYLQPSGLEVVPEGGGSRFWPYAEVRQTQGFYAGEEVRLERGADPAEAILVDGPGFLESLHEVAPTLGEGFHDPRHRRRRVRFTVLAAAASAAILGALYLWGIPALAATVAPWIPVPWEERLGEAVAQHLAPSASRCQEPEGVQALDRVVARLSGALRESPYRFRVAVADLPEVNAFAAPGGFIVLLRGLLTHVDAPESLAGVLAHEMQHVRHRHATRALVQHASTGLLVTLLTGDVSGFGAFGLEMAATLAALRYSRQSEEEADRDGTRLLEAAGLDPAGLLRFLESLEPKPTTPYALTYLSTHPSPTERAARLRALVAAAPAPRGPLLSDAEWAQLRGICNRGASP
jgi:predicted Zn-dependent protease